MPSINPQFYAEFWEWQAKTAREILRRILQQRTTPAQLDRFIGDCAQVSGLLVQAWEDVPRSGKLLSLLPKLARWALTNPDPLLPARVQMQIVRKKWDAEMSGP